MPLPIHPFAASELPVQRMLMTGSPPMNHRPLHVLQGDPGLPGVPATSGSPFRIRPLRVYPPTQVHVVVHLSEVLVSKVRIILG